MKTISDYVQYLRAKGEYSDERKMSFVIDDGKFETMKTAIVDLAFGLGIEFVNMQGFYRGEKLAKVLRFAEIVDDLIGHFKESSSI